VGGHPAFAPLAHLPITGADVRGDLLVAALRMFKRLQNDPCTHRLGLGRVVSTDELVKLFDFLCCQFY
jgi:hypothetical protein